MMKINKDDLAVMHEKIWDKSQLNLVEIILTIISFAAMLGFIIYVLILKVDKETTWQFFSDIGMKTMTAEYIAWTIHYFAPAIIPLIWGILAVKRFEFLRSRYFVLGTSNFAIVFMFFKLLLWIFILYVAGISYIAVDTVKVVILFLHYNHEKKEAEQTTEPNNDAIPETPAE